MRQYLGLVIGLLVGVAGAILYQQSLPPEEGSVKEELEEATAELRVAERRIAAMETEGKGRRGGRSTLDGMRTIAEKIRDGEDVSFDDVFATTKPWLRDMSPLLDHIWKIEEDERFDSIAGECSRKFNLSDRDEKELKEWLQRKSAENRQKYNAVINSDSSGFVDFVLAGGFGEQEVDGIEGFMEGRLQGDQLAQFKQDRMLERVDAVQEEANRRLHRIDEGVGLDETQLDEVFGILARGSQQYEAGMEFDGMGEETTPLQGAAREAAIRSVLRPDQLQRYEGLHERRRQEAEAEMRKLGMSLPKGWERLDDDGY